MHRNENNSICSSFSEWSVSCRQPQKMEPYEKRSTGTRANQKSWRQELVDILPNILQSKYKRPTQGTADFITYF